MIQNMNATDCELIQGLVTTIIPVYNRGMLVKATIDSVLNQTYKNFEIILVDDGSSDDTLSILKEFARLNNKIRVVSQKNAGPGAAREAGRHHAKGEFIQYLDSDDLLAPTKYETQIEALNKFPQADIAYGITMEKYSAEGSNEPRVVGRTDQQAEKLYPWLLESRWWSTHTPLYKREFTAKIGPWSELENEEDWEYEARAAALSAKLVFCDVIVCYRVFHNEGHLHERGSSDPVKLASRAKAKTLMFSHAVKASQNKNNYYWNHFLKSLFLLARQCGEHGLTTEARDLASLSAEGWHQIGDSAAKVKLYKAIANVLGWKTVARALKILGW